MMKDVIYIDIEDDITAIIEKVKNAETAIVALVPPKRVGVLQSIVNLKLLQRAAEHAKKRLVLITNDHALSALAAGVGIPIAKNLQSKPEMAPITALDTDEDDVIHGEDVAAAPVEAGRDTEAAGSSADTSTFVVPAVGATALAAEKAAKKPVAGLGVKIPNFDVFRKKLFILAPLAVLLVGFLVWAIFFAGEATVAITAKTNVVNISKTLQLTNGGQVNVAQSSLPAVVKQTKKTASVDFTATGKKDVGERAVGTVKLSTDLIPLLGKTVPAGTQLTASNGLVYTTNSAVTFTISNYNGANVGVTAAATGSKYNGATGSVSGLPKNVDGSFTTATAGGTDKTVTVVSADDIAKAREQLKAQDANAIKSELKKQFGATDVVIDTSFSVETAEPTATPALDQEATTAKLSAETTYTLVGVRRSDLKLIYDDYLKTHLKGNTTQKVYESGDTSTQFTTFEKNEAGYSTKISAVAQIGPNIDEGKLAEDIAGMRTGEVQQLVGAIQGVENVDVRYSPFWVNKVPDDSKRIKITFTLNSNE